VHEHWNNSDDKQYSRNLGIGDGIELVSSALETDGYRLISGKRIVVKDRGTDATKRRLTVLSKDPLIRTPASGSGNDPRTAGAVLRVMNPTTGESEEFVLQPGPNWTPLGNNPEARNGWRYRDRSFSEGPCKLLVLRPGRLLRAVCRATTQPIEFSLDEPVQESLTVTLRMGSAAEHCMSFGGEVAQDFGVGENPGRRDAGLFKSRGASAPSSCPVPP
jgi:hypothetical protein